MTTAQSPLASPLKLLLIKHSKGWDVDRVNVWAENRGHQVERCFPADGDEFPDPANFDGVVVFGGSMSANDCGVQPWIKPELAFIEQCIACDTKFFGICLGAQLLARVLGAKVSEHVEGKTEVGFYPLSPVGDGEFVEDGVCMFQWHREGFELPAGATRLASSELFPQQAYSLPAGHFGVQFHPEVNPASLSIWQNRIPPDRYPWLTPELQQTHREQCEKSDARVTQWLEQFLDRWIAGRAL